MQNKGGVGLYEPESKSISSNGADPANLKAGAELEKAIGQLPPEQQQQLGRFVYVFDPASRGQNRIAKLR